MKTLKLILLVFALGIMQSCYKPATIRVQNNITQVKIVDVKWGEVYLATELLPGETSEKSSIEKYEKELLGKHPVSFIMTANNKSIYLETEEEFLLNEDDDILIILTDDTQVKNPNE
ncbi:MAG: hypothetical protein CVU09_00865 [Bacteroidetes bacterium HGW-Bacteroidetes-4]|jgi:hypothetical protein|nr:MAG: hypothetical protein CVU09_00865 [Bacteroidetes bacterium HGW-Bacteroidetes-4]